MNKTGKNNKNDGSVVKENHTTHKSTTHVTHNNTSNHSKTTTSHTHDTKTNNTKKVTSHVTNKNNNVVKTTHTSNISSTSRSKNNVSNANYSHSLSNINANNPDRIIEERYGQTKDGTYVYSKKVIINSKNGYNSKNILIKPKTRAVSPKVLVGLMIAFFAVCIICLFGDEILDSEVFQVKDKTFYLLSSYDNYDFNEQLKEYAYENNIDLVIDYMDDLETIEELEQHSFYDAVWMSNSVWLYMLEDTTVSNSKSTNINPVVFGIKKSKANELGFVNKDVYNKDIVNAIKNGKLNYIMSSVTKTNTGMIGYLGFLNSLAGSPEILTSDMLKSKQLTEDLKTLFSGVERVSGSISFLEDMFINSEDYEAVLATESSLISINKQLESMGKEPLYLIYPVDGVAINDSPFAFIENGNNEHKEETFLKIQSFLLSDETQKELEKLGKRTWYGGTKENADSNSFKKSWGIDTTKYLMPLKYPSKDVMDEAIIFYINSLRKPSSIAFCLDFSGSMFGDGERELKKAINFILDEKQASTELIQFSENDKIYVLPFASSVKSTYKTNSGIDTQEVINSINNLEPNGGTDIYNCSIEALKLLEKDSDEYNKTVILMTDGESQITYQNLYNYYTLGSNSKIPIYSIMFGSANESQLFDIAQLTNAKVFDGRTDLIEAFKEVRSYN